MHVRSRRVPARVVDKDRVLRIHRRFGAGLAAARQVPDGEVLLLALSLLYEVHRYSRRGNNVVGGRPIPTPERPTVGLSAGDLGTEALRFSTGREFRPVEGIARRTVFPGLHVLGVSAQLF